MWNLRLQTFPKLPLQPRDMRRAFRQVSCGDLRCDSRADDGRNVLHAGAPSAFLRAAMQDARQSRAPAAIQHADALRSIEAMRREREQRRAELAHVHRQPARARLGIDVESDAAFRCDPANPAHRFDGADVVIHMMHGDENGLIRHRLTNGGGVHQTVRIHLHLGRSEALGFEELYRAQHRRMFDGAEDDVIPPLLIRVSRAFDREIRGLRAVRREKDVLGRFRADERRHLLTRLRQRIPRAQAVRMQRGGVAEVFGEVRAHRLERLRQERRGGLMIEVDRRHRGKRRGEGVKRET